MYRTHSKTNVNITMNNRLNFCLISSGNKRKNQEIYEILRFMSKCTAGLNNSLLRFLCLVFPSHNTITFTLKEMKTNCMFSFLVSKKKIPPHSNKLCSLYSVVLFFLSNL